MIDTFLYEFKNKNEKVIDLVKENRISALDFYQLGRMQLETLNKVDPSNPLYVSQLAEFYHLDGNLRKAGEQYRKVFELDPLLPITKEEERLIQKFCPVLLINKQECFPLKDIVAVHHPLKPLIGYHLFWEDDYDFPDDYEPCDHEEVWVEYNPDKEEVTNVMCWFHARVLESQDAVEEAHRNQQRAIIRIEWGKHGSLLCGWENMQEPLTGIPLSQWLNETYKHVKAGGRVPSHPLKKFWPAGFQGTYEEYSDFSELVDPLHWLEKKPLCFKTKWVNAVIFTYALLYNFHAKMEWPERFFQSIDLEL